MGATVIYIYIYAQDQIYLHSLEGLWSSYCSLQAASAHFRVSQTRSRTSKANNLSQVLLISLSEQGLYNGIINRIARIAFSTIDKMWHVANEKVKRRIEKSCTHTLVPFPILLRNGGNAQLHVVGTSSKLQQDIGLFNSIPLMYWTCDMLDTDYSVEDAIHSVN